MLSVKEQLLHQIDNLTPEQQKQVLDYTLQLQQSKLPPGTPGRVLVERARKINFPKEDLAEIAEAIKDFEKINLDEW